MGEMRPDRELLLPRCRAFQPLLQPSATCQFPLPWQILAEQRTSNAPVCMSVRNCKLQTHQQLVERSRLC